MHVLLGEGLDRVYALSDGGRCEQEGWQLQRRRGEVMEALDASIRHLLSLEAPLNAWAAHSAQAEAALISAAGRSCVDPILSAACIPLTPARHLHRHVQSWACQCFAMLPLLQIQQTEQVCELRERGLRAKILTCHFRGNRGEGRQASVLSGLVGHSLHCLASPMPETAHTPADMAGGQVPARLRHFLQLRTQWLNISGEHVASVARVGQAVMHLELAR